MTAPDSSPTELEAEVAAVLERHLGACGRFGLPCAEVRPRGEWCGRCDLRACITDALAPLFAAREARARAEGAREALEGAGEALPRMTEGTDRAGTDTWRPHDRDVYSLAIEEAQAVLRERAEGYRGDA